LFQVGPAIHAFDQNSIHVANHFFDAVVEFHVVLLLQSFAVFLDAIPTGWDVFTAPLYAATTLPPGTWSLALGLFNVSVNAGTWEVSHPMTPDAKVRTVGQGTSENQDKSRSAIIGFHAAIFAETIWNEFENTKRKDLRTFPSAPEAERGTIPGRSSLKQNTVQLCQRLNPFGHAAARDVPRSVPFTLKKNFQR
jgi:hypothetical protein